MPYTEAELRREIRRECKKIGLHENIGLAMLGLSPKKSKVKAPLVPKNKAMLDEMKSWE